MTSGQLHKKNAPALMAGIGTVLFLLSIPIPGGKFIQDSEYYLPLHTTLEMFAVFVSFTIFVLIWIGRRDRTTSDIVLGCGFLAVGLIDFAHTLSYAGMPTFVTPSGPEKAIDFWLAARFIAAITLFSAGIGISDGKEPTDRFEFLALLVSLVASAAVYWIVLWHEEWTPRTFIPSEGLTPYKIATEVVIVIITLAASIALLRKFKAGSMESVGYLAAAAWVGGLGELFFTVYANVTDLYNLLGHGFKVFAYALIFRGLAVRLIRDPRFRAEQELRRSEEDLKAAQAVAHVGSWVLDIAANKLECSDETYRLFGLPVGTALSLEAFVGCIHPDDREMVLSEWHRALSGAPYDIEHRILNVGPTRWVHERAEILFAPDGTPVSGIGTVQDITERKVMEAERRAYQEYLEQQVAERTRTLSESEQRYRELAAFDEVVLESMPAGLLIIDLQGHILRCNRPLLEMLGYRETELLGQKAEALLPERFRMSHPTQRTTYFNDLAVRKSMKERQFLALTKDGREIPVDIGLNDIGEGDARKVVCTLRDISERDQLMRQLAQKEHFMRSLIDLIPGMVGYWDRDLRCGFANNAYVEWFGRTPEQMLGIRIQDLMGEELFRKNEPFMREALSGKQQHFERTLTKADGSTGYTWAHYVPDIVGGNVRGFFVLVSDVTELKNIQFELEHSNHSLQEERRRLSIATDAGKVGIWDYDVTHNQMSWDDWMYRIYGITRDRFAGAYEAWSKSVHPEDLPESATRLQATIDHGVPFDSTFRILHPNGSVRWIRGVGTRVVDEYESEQITRVIGANFDITESVDAERQIIDAQRALQLHADELSASRQTFNALFEDAPDGILASDGEGRIVMVNDQAAVMLGYTREELLGEEVEILVPERYRNIHVEYRVDYARHPQRRAMGKGSDLSVRRKDGTEILAEISLNTVVTPKSKLVITIIHDVTERKLTSKLAAMGETITAVAHQWRQPLNVVSGVLGNIGDALTHDDDPKGYIEEQIAIASSNLQYMSQTIQDFKDYLKPNRTDEHFDLGQAISKVLLISGSQVNNYAIVVKNCIEGAIAVKGYQNDFQQVLFNLLGNAVDAIKEKRTRGQTAGEIRLDIVNDGEVVNLRVTDDGIGIPHEIQNRVFEPYFTTKSAQSGTGIGLYLSRMIMEKKFASTLRLLHSDDRTTTFEIVLVREPTESPHVQGIGS